MHHHQPESTVYMKACSSVTPSVNSIQFSHSVMPNSLWPHGLQHARLLCPSPTPRVWSNSCPSSRWCHPTTSSCRPLLLLPSVFPDIRVFPKSFALSGQIIEASALASALPMNIQDWFPLEWLVGSPCSPRDSQESSPTPQFKSISSLALSFLYGPALISIHNYWKNHSFD